MNHLPAGSEYIGTARCSEAEPQCTDIGKLADGSLVFANESGTCVIPADEISAALVIAQQVA